MQTLTQSKYLDRDEILKGVVNWIVKESPMTGILPMKPMQGNALLYNVSLTLPTAAWLTAGDQISESTGTFEQRTATIYTLLQNAYTDKGVIQRNATQDPEAIDIELASQAMAHEFERQLMIGQTTTLSSVKQMKGLLKLIAEFESEATTDLDGAVSGAVGNNSQVLAAGATNGATSMPLIDELIDMIKPGKPDLILMSRLTRRRVNTLMRAAGTSGLQMIDSDLFGKKIASYDEIPVYVSDWLPDNFPDNSSSVLDISAYDYDAARSSGDSLDCSVIFAMQIGEKKLQGLQSGQMTHERETFIEDYNAIANRFVWYPGMMCESKYSLAILTGLLS